ncbi:TPA: hypothetical protein GM645_00065 [Klebsiella pneumoniae]|nr:hypothetical protein [Klebsiella pneumoniae]HBX0707462.1 hypothetical protein [Klebsiella pneumoniae]HCB0969501.1 hypothetical protein [Klebsiella pneumoniae]HCB1251203.1 hypothetical protein [Klebsiella pneumoniae]
MIKSKCALPEHAAESEDMFPWMFSDIDSRDKAIHLRDEIAQRNIKAMDENIKHWEGLSKAATLYYKSEFNKQRNSEMIKRLGTNQIMLSTKERHIDRASGLVGERYGKLTIIARDKQEILCVCDCGTEKVYNRGNVVSGKTRSCGCAKEKK